jgi:predicted O-methyltransferase YrrM
MKQLLKRLAPAWLLRAYRRIWQRVHSRHALESVPAAARELYRRSALTSYEHVTLPAADEALRQQVISAAVEIYGESWNYYSDALRPEIAMGFVQTIESMDRNRPVAYLEIGSCQGLSMSFIALLLQRRGMLRSLTSIDPYFAEGYVEGALGPYEHEKHVPIGKTTKACALTLYERLRLSVELLEMTSEAGLKRLLSAGTTFDLIYIDGYHETLVPLVDLGLSLAALSRPGLIILDDYMWPDVAPLKALCDRHARRVQETWKTASYAFT